MLQAGFVLHSGKHGGAGASAGWHAVHGKPQEGCRLHIKAASEGINSNAAHKLNWFRGRAGSLERQCRSSSCEFYAAGGS